MERPIFKPAGTPVGELDTPALVVDLTVLEQNIERLHSFFRDRPSTVRPRVSAHCCPAIAHRQLAAGGAAGGVCVDTVGQAEAFASSGIRDVLLANQVVTAPKIRRACALAGSANVTLAVDSAENVRDLSEAAAEGGVTLDAAVEVRTSGNGCGVGPGRPAVDLARQVAAADGLRFAGLLSRERAPSHEDGEGAAGESRRGIQRVLDTRQMLEREGIEVSMVCLGGTHNYRVAGAMDGVTEVLAGTYALMDGRSARRRSEFQPAATVVTTVISAPEPDLVIVDSGQKAVGVDHAMPLVLGHPSITIPYVSAEHCNIYFDADSERPADLGDKLRLIPWDIGACVNLYDFIRAVRNEKLEAVWDVSARGRYR
jgi:D-serine deaminase-like pyridoxal phosphate-dependent protein